MHNGEGDFVETRRAVSSFSPRHAVVLHLHLESCILYFPYTCDPHLYAVRCTLKCNLQLATIFDEGENQMDTKTLADIIANQGFPIALSILLIFRIDKFMQEIVIAQKDGYR